MPHKQLNILLVEDHPIQQLAEQELLASEGFTNVTSATKGAEAIELVKSQHFDLIILDLGLPDIDGYTVCETIREFEVHRELQSIIVALTAHSDLHYQQQSTIAGMDGFFVKPMTKQTINNILNTYGLLFLNESMKMVIEG